MKGNSMASVDAWNQGHQAGVKLCVDQINKWCKTDFDTIADVIFYINMIADEDKRIEKSNKKLAQDIAMQNWLMSDDK
jgi:hypothetical protein